MISRTLSHYRILGEIGRGGMGIVYRAEDTKLKREVAIKVLPEAFAANEERLRRFEREAQVLASLNHPNIAAIHGLEETNGQRFLVLELVEGEDLAGRLDRGAIPLAEAIEIAKQVAEGLERAHERGVVHRDLKPGNLKVSGDGVVKILDFGLAKVLEGDAESPEAGDGSESPTRAHPATVAGAVLGTAAYMSPEQARGKAVDRRADVWAFGAVLYEMLTGRKPFEGGAWEPDFDALSAATPQSIRRLLKRCLESDPKKRLRDMGDAKLELEEAQAAKEGASRSTIRRPAWPLALSLAGAAAAGALVMWILAPPPHPTRGVVRGMIADAGGRPVHVHFHTTGLSLLLSPDGDRIVYNPNQGDGGGLAVQPTSDFVSEPLPDLGGHAHPLAFSPDGASILFTTSAGGLFRSELASRSLPQRICSTSTVVWGADWFPDDTIVFATGEPSSLYRVPVEGGTAAVLATTGEWDLKWPSVLPGGNRLLVAGGATDGSLAFGIAVVSLATGEVRVVQPGGTMPHYLSTGYLVFSAESQLRGVRFDPRTAAVEGASVTLIEGVETNPAGATNYALSRDGDLLYLSGSGGTRPVWVDRTGRETTLEIEPGRYQEPRISPEEGRVAFTDAAGRWDFLVWDEFRRTLTRVPHSSRYGGNPSPLWTPDGRELLYSVGLYSQSRLLRAAADGATPAVDLSVRGVKATSWSPDGETLLLQSYRPSNNDLFIMSMAGDGEPEPLLATPSDEQGGTLSPDGRWLAYMSNETGRFEAYVRPFPQVDGGKWLISTEGGMFPRWTRGGRELVYLSGTKMMAVSVSAGASFVAGRPEMLWDRAYFIRRGLRDFDVSPDGERFLFLREEGGVAMYLVQNWPEEVKAKVGPPP